jgi:hypothetical protein
MATTDKNMVAATEVAHEAQHHITVTEATQLADETDNVKYSPWTLHMFRLYGVLLCAYFCACLNGFDGSVMG